MNDNMERPVNARKKSSGGQQVMEWIKRRGSLNNQAQPNRLRRGSEKPSVNFTNDIKDYQLLYMIGQGGSANVFMGKYTKMDMMIAIKQINIEKFERHHIDELRNEIQIMSLCRHPNLLPIHKSFINEQHLWVITPVQNGGSCLDLLTLQFPTGVDEISCATIMRQCLQGLLYLHNNDLIHRDVKCANLLICKDTGLVQLSDFGVSKTLMDYGRKKNRSTFCGTPAWMAPELLEEKEYDEKADIWSFGITMIELATGKAPYSHFPPLKTILMTLKNPSPSLLIDEISQNYGKVAKQLVDTCLKKDPSERSSSEILNEHSFFKKAKQPLSLVSNLHLDSLAPLHERSISSRRETSFEEEQIKWDFGEMQIDRKHSEESKDSGYSSLSRRSSHRRDSINSQDTETSQIGRFIVESPALSRANSIERVSRFKVQRSLSKSESTTS
eukprot:NODE_66_length_23959_cov_0.323009.p2 type:complete len:442 gc:universal NODE_66_length_23959_cov_0.323009:13521-14846(+)